eukprot:8699452-Pyramimonas_sp.AAC.1
MGVPGAVYPSNIKWTSISLVYWGARRDPLGAFLGRCFCSSVYVARSESNTMLVSTSERPTPELL